MFFFFTNKSNKTFFSCINFIWFNYIISMFLIQVFCKLYLRILFMFFLQVFKKINKKPNSLSQCHEGIEHLPLPVVSGGSPNE